MSDLLTIKPLIRDFVAENISDEFNAVYWQAERLKVPQKPYCMLTEVSETKDKRTSTSNGDFDNDTQQRDKITTKYKTCLITVGVYVDGLNEYDVRKEFAYKEIDNLESLFEQRDVQDLFYPAFSVLTIGNIRALHQTVDGGYEFRYEFDLTLGYNEVIDTRKDIGKYVEADINVDDSEQTIHIEVGD